MFWLNPSNKDGKIIYEKIEDEKIRKKTLEKWRITNG